MAQDDTVVLVNDRFPNFAGYIELINEPITISLMNFVGNNAYVRYEPGRYTLGHMKTLGTPLKKIEGGSFTYQPVQADSWTTFMIQTDTREYLIVQVYVSK